MSSKIEVCDNFLPKEYFEKLVDEFTGLWFPYYLNRLDDKIGLEEGGHLQMTHIFYKDHVVKSKHFDLLEPLLGYLGVFSLLRLKINLLYRTDKQIEHGFHIDIMNAPKNAKTAVFYFNTNNGFTKFETGEKVESVANRIAIFPNDLKHTGSTNTCQTPYRLVLNIDYI